MFEAVLVISACIVLPHFFLPACMGLLTVLSNERQCCSLLPVSQHGLPALQGSNVTRLGMLALQAVNHVGIPFAKQTMWRKAIEKGTLDSCREVHEDLVRHSPYNPLSARQTNPVLFQTALFAQHRPCPVSYAHQTKTKWTPTKKYSSCPMHQPCSPNAQEWSGKPGKS